MLANLLHVCLSKILSPLIDAGDKGKKMTSGDGYVRMCHPIFAADVGDYLEQIAKVGCKMGECPECPVPSEELGDYEPDYDPRNIGEILDALKMYDTHNIVEFTSACAKAGIKPIVHPFWEKLPYCNIYRCITPDVLHQLYQGLIKHMVSWIKSAYDKAELDARVRRLPPNHHVRQFFKGITSLSRLTGHEHNDMARILLGLVADMKLKNGGSSVQLVRAVRVLLDFLYLAQYPVHTTKTLALLEDALRRFHENKSIFVTLKIRKHWKLPKLHFLKHYVTLIKWLGTTDNFNTEYTERLHIDLAKDAYAATNHKDEFYQMTLWLERKEKILHFSQYVTWRQQSDLIPGYIDRPISPSSSLSSDSMASIAAYLTKLEMFPNRVKMTKHPTIKAAKIVQLQQAYHAPYFSDALARYLVASTLR